MKQKPKQQKQQQGFLDSAFLWGVAAYTVS